FSGTLKTAGTQSITASDGSRTASQTGIVVNPATVTSLVVAGFPNPTTAGVAHAFTVTAKDEYGNTVTGYTGTVTLSSSDGQAVSPASPSTSAGADAGTHTFSGTLKTAGTQSITANDSTRSASQTGIVVNAAAVNNLLVSGYVTTTAGDAHSFTVTAK